MSSRAVSSVIGVVLMVAVVVILSTTVGVFVLGAGADLRDPAPVIGQSTGGLTPNADSDGSAIDDGGIVRIEHLAGESVAVGDIEVAVDARRACSETARIQNFPGPTPSRKSSTPTYLPFNDDNFEQGVASFVSQGRPTQQWDAGALHEDTDNTFDAGSFFEFRINKTECELRPGEQITVRVVHLPSNAIILAEELTA